MELSKALRFLVSGLLLGVLASRTDWELVSATFARLRLDVWIGAVILYAMTQVVSGWRWRIIAAPLGFQQSLMQFTGFYFVGMFFNLILPTSVGGDVVRAYYLDGRSGRKLNAFLSVFSDRLSGLLVLLALASVAALFCPVELPWWIHASVWGTVGCAAAGFALLPQLLSSSLLNARLERIGREVLRSLTFVVRPAPLVLSIVVQAANVVLVWMVGQAIAAPIPASYYWILVPMVTLLTLLPVSLNGMGVREGAMVLFLAPLGVPEGTALSLGFLWFCVFTTTGLCGGLVYLFGRFPRLEVQTDHGPVSHHSDQGRTRQSQAAA